MTDISNMTVDQLEKHILEAQEILKKKKAEKVKDNRRKIEEFAKNLGTSVAETFGMDGSMKEKKKKEKKVLYIDSQGKKWGRASKEWTPDQKLRYKNNLEAQSD
jgi:hypothetical protein